MENDLIQDTNLDLLQVQVASVEYSGQAPINVDNQQHIISLDPSALSSKLDTSAFDEWTATHSATEYSAGDGIDITDHIISVTGQLTGDYLTKASADTLYQPIGDYLTTADSGNFYPMTSNPSGYLTAHQDVSNKLDVTAFTAYTATAQVTEYSAGENIDITNHVISGKDWSAEIENATTGKLDATAFNSGDFYPMTGNPSGFLTGVDLTPYQEKTGMTAYQPIGDYYSASNPSGFITGVDLSNYYQKNETSSKEEISAALTGKLDESAFTAYTATATAVQGVEYSGIAPIDVNNTTHQISADVWTLSGASGISILEDNENKVTTIACTTVPDLSNYYTKTDTSSKQEINAAITGKQDNLTFAYNVNSAISSINGSALVGGISEDTIDLSAGEGISIVETADKVLISCTGAGIPTQVVANSGLATGQNILYVVTGS